MTDEQEEQQKSTLNRATARICCLGLRHYVYGDLRYSIPAERALGLVPGPEPESLSAQSPTAAGWK